MAEHPFGTIKRQWGFSYILTKEGMNRAGADVGFLFIAYNISLIILISCQANPGFSGFQNGDIVFQTSNSGQHKAIQIMLNSDKLITVYSK